MPCGTDPCRTDCRGCGERLSKEPSVFMDTREKSECAMWSNPLCEGEKKLMTRK